MSRGRATSMPRRRRVLYAAGIVLAVLTTLAAVSSAVERAASEEGRMFHDVAGPLASPRARSEGACWADIDSDGDTDLFVTDVDGAPRLWRNDGDGRFVDIAREAGIVAGTRRANSCAFIDLTNDGIPELFLGAKSNVPAPASENRLFLGVDGRRYVDVTGQAGVGMPRVFLGSPDWADFDQDGDYDLFASVRFGSGDREHRVNSFFQQTTPLRFRDIAPETGLADPPGLQSTWVASWFDYDADGDLDLLLGLDFWGIELFRNDGGKFTRVTSSVFPPAQDETAGAPPNNPMGVTWGDVDNDGCMDVWVSGTDLPGQGGFGAETLGDLASRLYRNRCDGTFEDITKEAGFSPTGTVQWSANFVDFDNDGDLDLSVVAGKDSEYTGPRQQAWKLQAKEQLSRVVSALRALVAFFLPNSTRLAEWGYRYEVMIPAVGARGMAAAMPNFLYRNMLVETGTLRFVNANALLLPPDFGSTVGSAWADMDGDGDLDWFVPNRGGASRLYRNDGPVGNYLRVHVTGRPLRDAIGAWVKIKAGGRWQIRHVHILDGHLSQSQMDPHFGLGKARRVEELWVRWPGETRWERLCGSGPANVTVSITQGGPCTWPQSP